MKKKRNPPIQTWGIQGKPTEDEMSLARNGFIKKGYWDTILKISQDSDSYPVPVPLRKKNSLNQYLRCYFFFSHNSFDNCDDNIGCIDTQKGGLRIVLTKRRVRLLSPSLKHLLVNCDDGTDYLEKEVVTDPKAIIKILQSIRDNYLDQYDLTI